MTAAPRPLWAMPLSLTTGSSRPTLETCCLGTVLQAPPIHLSCVNTSNEYSLEAGEDTSGSDDRRAFMRYLAKAKTLTMNAGAGTFPGRW